MPLLSTPFVPMSIHPSTHPLRYALRTYSREPCAWCWVSSEWAQVQEARWLDRCTRALRAGGALGGGGEIQQVVGAEEGHVEF